MDGDLPEFDHDVERALVTGATGGVGAWIVDRLAESGVEVVGVDLERPAGDRSNATFRDVDLTDAGETAETVHEVDPDAVVHCAAISGPLEDPATRVVGNNVMSTWTTLQAAGRAGVPVVWTSSQAAYGALFAREPWVPDELPVDESHERRPEDPYGLSKLCGEEIAKMVARRYGIGVATLRPASIYEPDELRTRPRREGFDLSAMELSGNFWSYVDVRDVARMVEAALAAELAGHETFLCVADENTLGHPTAELIEATGHELPERCALEGTEAALSNAKAERLLGWRPKYGPGDGAGSEAAPTIAWR